MPRKRSQVREDALQLKQFEAGIAGTRNVQAIRMLRLLEEEPDRTLSECAAMLNRPERTVRRWWKLYLEEGVEALLSPATDATASSKWPMPGSRRFTAATAMDAPG